ncbi:MAG: RagB/SusD family nutrient uptake outer membrane protein [Prevotella sp.]|jgi:hypothetical protein|nr:RagB/SusD family nutrient uptake outer membrane protein [Prevotella sp.]
MKNKKIYIAAILLALICNACNDWLDVDPVGKVLEEKQFSTEDNIQHALNGLYRQMTGGNLYGGQLSQTSVELMAHYYLYPTSSFSDEVPLLFYNLSTHSYWSAGPMKKLTGIWTDAYKTLLNINNYIKGVNESKAVMSEDHRNILLGEAYGLRAYLHFDLYRLFCPYNAGATDKVLPYNRSANITLNHDGYKDDVYCTPGEYLDFLFKDLEEAKKLLQEDPIQDAGSGSITNDLREDFYKNRNRRMNYYALKGLEARILQYLGRDSEAAAAAKEITDRIEEDKIFHWVNISKMVEYRNYIFFSEVVFGINNINSKSSARNLYLGDNILKEVYVVNENNLFKNIFKEYSNQVQAGNPSPRDILDIRAWQWDLSEILTIQTIYYPTDASYVSYKYKTESQMIPAVNSLQVLMRVSEMYYIQAESALKSGQRDIAINLLNEVLRHRGLNIDYLLKVDASDSEIRAHLTREYYREFFGEGQVYFYHKRLQSPEMFKGNGEGSVAVGTNTYAAPVPDTEENI